MRSCTGLPSTQRTVADSDMGVQPLGQAWDGLGPLRTVDRPKPFDRDDAPKIFGVVLSPWGCAELKPREFTELVGSPVSDRDVDRSHDAWQRRAVGPSEIGTESGL